MNAHCCLGVSVLSDMWSLWVPSRRGGVVRRFAVNKKRSVRHFRKQAARTHVSNMIIPGRTGFRL